MHLETPLPAPSQALSHPGWDTTPTGATGIERLRALTHLSEGCRRDLISSISLVAKYAGLPREALRLEPGFLREKRALDLPLAPPSMELGNRRAIRSRFCRAMYELGVVARDDTPIEAIWQACLLLMEKEEDRRGLNSFARFCSAREIAPEAVCLETLLAFLQHLTERTLHRQPRKHVGAVRTAWNAAAARIAGWPGPVLPEITDPDQFILPPGAFPKAFLDDLDCMVAEMTAAIPEDPFGDDPDDDGQDGQGEAARPVHKPIALITAEGHRDHARWAASALIALRVPAEEITSRTCLVTPITRARDILRYVHQKKGGKPSPLGNHIGAILHIIGKYDARLSRKDLARIKAWRKPVTKTYTGMTDKNRACVRRVLAADRETWLRAAPGALFTAARALRETAPKEAVSLAFQATVIQLLSFNPLRQGNLRALEFDRHLKRAEGDGGLITHIDVAAEETKNDRQILAPVAAETARMVQAWIDEFRPMIPGAGGVYLFPGHKEGNCSITAQSLRASVKAATLRHVGVPVTPHQFRHIAAEAYLREFPGEYEVVRQFLNHASIETTLRAYCDRESEAGMKRFEEAMLARRARLGKKKGKAPAKGAPKAGGR